MILLLDNYDSFTYNLAEYLGEFGCTVEVHRNDKISVEHIAQRKPEAIIISPGPCTPQEAGVSVELVQKLAGKFPILGVCLGHQAIGAAFGGKDHSRAETFSRQDQRNPSRRQRASSRNLPEPFTATRYHSLIVERESYRANSPLPRKPATASSWACATAAYKLEGVQFPLRIRPHCFWEATPQKNFLSL